MYNQLLLYVDSTKEIDPVVAALVCIIAVLLMMVLVLVYALWRWTRRERQHSKRYWLIFNHSYLPLSICLCTIWYINVNAN